MEIPTVVFVQGHVLTHVSSLIVQSSLAPLQAPVSPLPEKKWSNARGLRISKPRLAAK